MSGHILLDGKAVAKQIREQLPVLAGVELKFFEDSDSGGDSEFFSFKFFGEDTGVLTRTKPETKKPSMYKVLLLNDDYTRMEFVIVVLMRIFSMGQEKATEVMLHVHRRGVGICGVYPFEVAETKVTQVVDFARRNEHPLQCTMEKD